MSYFANQEKMPQSISADHGLFVHMHLLKVLKVYALKVVLTNFIMSQNVILS